MVSGAILAAEDKNFFSHNGVDYSSIPRVLSKLRITKSSGTTSRSWGGETRRIVLRSSRKADRRSLNSSCEVIFSKPLRLERTATSSGTVDSWLAACPI